MPMAASRLMAPVGMAATLTRADVGAHPHDGALAELLLDLGDGEPERLPAVGFEPGFVSGHGVLWYEVTDFATQH